MIGLPPLATYLQVELPEEVSRDPAVSFLRQQAIHSDRSLKAALETMQSELKAAEEALAREKELEGRRLELTLAQGGTAGPATVRSRRGMGPLEAPRVAAVEALCGTVFRDIPSLVSLTVDRLLPMVDPDRAAQASKRVGPGGSGSSERGAAAALLGTLRDTVQGILATFDSLLHEAIGMVSCGERLTRPVWSRLRRLIPLAMPPRAELVFGRCPGLWHRGGGGCSRRRCRGTPAADRAYGSTQHGAHALHAACHHAPHGPHTQC